VLTWLGETNEGLKELGYTEEQIASMQSDRRRAAVAGAIAAATAADKGEP